MNARYPARPAGMFGPVNRTHVVAALAAALGVVAGAAGAAAWDVADSDDAYRVYSPPAINIDRVAEQAAVNDAAPIATGVSGADRISAAGRGFVDVDSLEATVSTNAPVSLDGAISGADRISASGNGFVDVDEVIVHAAFGVRLDREQAVGDRNRVGRIDCALSRPKLAIAPLRAVERRPRELVAKGQRPRRRVVGDDRTIDAAGCRRAHEDRKK